MMQESHLDGKIFNSVGTYVAVVRGDAVHDLNGRKVYQLKGTKIYKLSGELVGHLDRRDGSDARLSKSTDALF
jgi:hypothetical protein